MVGNDVVDLRDEDVLAGPSHPRFDRRVFARSERRALGASGAPDRLRWMLWAAKEAAYKLWKKRDPRTIFSPSRFVVQLDASLHGEVLHGPDRIVVDLATDLETIHAVARDAAESRIVTGLEPLRPGADASESVRDLVVRTLGDRFGAAEEIRIGKRGRVPTLLVPGAVGPLDLSLSHHGRFVAFACDLGRTSA